MLSARIDELANALEVPVIWLRDGGKEFLPSNMVVSFVSTLYFINPVYAVLATFKRSSILAGTLLIPSW